MDYKPKDRLINIFDKFSDKFYSMRVKNTFKQVFLTAEIQEMINQNSRQIDRED